MGISKTMQLEELEEEGWRETLAAFKQEIIDGRCYDDGTSEDDVEALIRAIRRHYPRIIAEFAAENASPPEAA